MPERGADHGRSLVDDGVLARERGEVSSAPSDEVVQYYGAGRRCSRGVDHVQREVAVGGGRVHGGSEGYGVVGGAVAAYGEYQVGTRRPRYRNRRHILPHP